MTKTNGKICNEYTKLPICSPDFIYLDAPDQFNIKGNQNGININHVDMPTSKFRFDKNRVLSHSWNYRTA